MIRGKTTLDYSAVQQCESKVDASFRRIRLARTKFKKNQSDAKETYLRKILDVHRKADALERQKAYNKRIRLKKELKMQESSSVKSRDEQESPIKGEQQPIEERLSEAHLSSSASEGSHKSDKSDESEFDSSPYKRAVLPTTSQTRGSSLGQRLMRDSTNTLLRVDSDLQRDYEAGRLSRGQYHKILLFRKKLIHCTCLEDLDPHTGRKDIDAVEAERDTVRQELLKVVARHPKDYSSLHPRAKVVTSHAYSIAFRPHREERPRRSVAETQRPVSRSEEKSVSVSHTSRQQFYVTSRPGTAGESLGGGTSLRLANPKHGGRLSSRNLVNYLLNRPPQARKSTLTPHPPEVRTAVQKARERVLEERCRSVPKGENIRLKGLFQLARSRQSRVSSSFVEVGLDIPSRLPSPRDSEEGEK